MIATFNPPNKKPVQVVVDSVTGIFDVPKEATANLYGVGTIVFVGLADGVQRISADVEYIVKKHSNANGTEPAEPTPSVVQQILNEAQNANKTSADAKKLATDAKDIAQSVRTDADEGKFNGAKGEKGETGTTPQLKISEDNLWHVSYDNGETWVSLGVKATGDTGAAGEDGLTPRIGENGDWWIGDIDTGVSAKGPKGDPGPDDLVIVTYENGKLSKTYDELLADINANKIVAIKDVGSQKFPYYLYDYLDSTYGLFFSASPRLHASPYQRIFLPFIGVKSDNTITANLGITSGTVPSGGKTGQILAKKSDKSYAVQWVDPPAEIPEDYQQIREDVGRLKENLESTNSILEENLIRISANLINPANMLENTTITISNRISTSSNTTYKSYLNIPVKAGESYYIGNSHRVSCVIDNAENKLVLQSNPQNKTEPYVFHVEKSGLLCVCFYMTEEKPWVALAEKETEYEEYGSKLLQEWLKLQIEKYGYSNPLKGKTIYNFGDSISNGQGNLVGDKRLGPAELVALDNDMVCTDFSVSGSTMSTSGGGNYTLKRINDAISASPITPDFVLLAGGINDLKVTSIGDFSEPSSNDDFGENYIGLLDTSNFSGAFETAIYRILNAWPGTQLIYMTEHKIPSHYNDGTEKLYQIVRKICKKWCVPILDMWNEGGLNMSVLANNKAYGTGDVNSDGTHTDTTHPNGEAYRLYYVPKLKAKLLECCPKTD